MAYTLTSRSTRVAAAAVTIIMFALASCGSDESKASAKFTAPTSGANIAGSVTVAMTADGVTIEPAGDVHKNAGHFHVIADDGCTKVGSGISKDIDHVHFGKAQTEGTIYLGPGTHELCLQVGDGAHAALDITDRVTVSVGVTDRAEFCAVIAEVDGIFNSVNEEDFATVKAAYANGRRLLAQLEPALDQVDADARDDVADVIAYAVTFTEVIGAAADEQAAEAALAPYWSGEVVVSPVGAAWILDNCNVDVEG